MKIIDGLPIKGIVSVVCRDTKTGKIKARRQVNNLVVQSGLNLAAAALKGETIVPLSLIALGENDPVTLASIEQTELVSPHTPSVSATVVLNQSPATIVYTATFGAGVVVGDVGEAGLFNADDLMGARTTFSNIPKGPDDEITVTWTLIFG